MTQSNGKFTGGNLGIPKGGGVSQQTPYAQSFQGGGGWGATEKVENLGL